MPLDLNENEFTKFESIVQSMTIKERNFPELIEKQKNRRKRIAIGAGRKEVEIDSLLKRFGTMRAMLKNIGQKPSLLGKIPGFKQMGQMAQMSGAENPFGTMGGIPQNFATNSRGPLSSISKNAKGKKDKRKKQKLARKKNKKRK